MSLSWGTGWLFLVDRAPLGAFGRLRGRLTTSIKIFLKNFFQFFRGQLYSLEGFPRSHLVNRKLFLGAWSTPPSRPGAFKASLNVFLKTFFDFF